MAWVVKAAAAVIRVGGADRYVYRGAALPEGVENLKHLADAGLVVEVADPEEPEPIKASRRPSSK